MNKKARLTPTATEQTLLEEVRVVLIASSKDRRRFQRLLDEQHYLGGLKPVGEQLYYVATDSQGQWLALLLFSAAAKHLKHREQWIGWAPAQCDRRLSLVVNNSRFLILPNRSVPNLGSRVLRLALDRLGADWQARYGHPVLVVETFVDPEQFNGTVYTAQGWQELGLTDGCGRHRRDYYVAHDKPKRLFVREVTPNARRSLQAERLKPALAGVEKKAGARCYTKCPELKSLAEHFRNLPEYRERVESYPVWSLVTLMLVAMLCDAPRGQKDLAKLARRLTQHQRRALGIRRNPKGRFPAPSQSTFSRLLASLDATRLNTRLPAGDSRNRCGVAAAAQRGFDRAGRQGTQPRPRGCGPQRRDCSKPVLSGQRAGGHQDKRNPRGAGTLRGARTGGAARGAGRAPHPGSNRARSGARARGGLSADREKQPAHPPPEH